MSQHPKIVSEKIDYKNKFMRIIRQRMRFHDGREKDYFILDRNSHFSIIIPLFEDGTTLLVGQHRVPLSLDTWEFPMGSVLGKTPLQTAKQELKEETGYTAKRYERIGSFHVAPGYTNQTSYVYVAKDLTEGVPTPEPFEDITVKRVRVSDVKKMVRNGTIKDGPTIVAVWFLYDYLQTS